MPIEQDILSDTRTCGEISCDDCNERFEAAQKVIAELRAAIDAVKSQSPNAE